MNTTTEGRPLDPRVIARIQAQHSRRVRGGPDGNFLPDVVVTDGKTPPWLPVDLLAYEPGSGAYAGAAGAADHDGRARLDARRYVVVGDDFLPTDDDLQTVRVDSEGIVHPAVLRKPLPPPPAAPGPSDDPGVPLTERVIEQIREGARAVISAGALAPVVKYWRPTLELAFRPQDGRYVGSTLTPQVAEHRHELVCVLDDAVPTPEHLRRVRRHANGWVTWADPEPVA